MLAKFIVILSLYAEDVTASAHFYRDVLAFDSLPHHDEQPAFTVNGIHLTILKGKPPVPAQDIRPPFPIFAFSVDDLDAIAARLEKHHIALPWGVEENADTRWIRFHDPAGNVIEAAQFKEKKRPTVSHNHT